MEPGQVLRLLDEDRIEELRERSAQEDAIESAAHALREFEERRQAATMPSDGLEHEAGKLEDECRALAASVRSAPKRKPRFDWTLPAPSDQQANGAFQFHSATPAPMPPYFDVTARPEGGFYFAGRRLSDDTGRYGFEVLLLAHYQVEFYDLPPSASGVWVSHPSVDLRGDVWAESLRGSTTAECTLFRTQFLFHVLYGQQIPIASRTTEQLVVRTVSHNSKRVVLEGLYSMPVIEFTPQLPGETIYNTLEVRFKGSVRGRTAEVTLGTSPPHDGVVLQIPQWRAVPY
jgi:hypothetical protein